MLNRFLRKPNKQQISENVSPIVPATNARASKQKPAYDINAIKTGKATLATPPTTPANQPPPANNTSGIPSSPVRIAEMQQPTKTQDQLYDERINDLLAGPRDTSEDEQLLREQMLRDVGAGQANLNARMAASGMGTSGALSGLSTDMRARAAYEAANAISGVRQDARDEFARNTEAGIGLVNQDRNLDVQEAKYQQYLDMMNEMFGQETKPGVDEATGKVDLDNAEVGQTWENPDGTYGEVVETPDGKKGVIIHPKPSSGNPIFDWIESVFSHKEVK